MIFAMQYCMDIDIALRSQIGMYFLRLMFPDFIFIGMEDSISNKERLWKNFFSIFPTFDMFQQVMDQCTQDFGFMVLNRMIKSTRIEDKVFYYRADPTPPFRMGSWQFWEYDRLRNRANQQAVEERERDDDALQEIQKTGRGNKPRITVVRDEL